MKLKSIIIISLSIAFLGAMALVAQNQHGEKRGNKNFRMYQKLNLTEEQQDQISTMKINHQMELVDLGGNLEKKKLEMAEMKNYGNYSREQYIAAVESINTAKDEIAISRANFKMDIYELLDADQKKEWNELSLNRGERKEKRNKESRKYKNID
jgi:Spy/CpxP family protein refolding chaperone